MKSFEAGQEVILVHTGVQAVVVRLEPPDMVIVRVDDGTEIPVFMENLSDMATWMAGKDTFSTHDDYVPYVKEKVEDQELLFALVPMLVSEEGVAAKYEVILVNATEYDLFGDIQLVFGQDVELTISERIPAFSPKKIDALTPAEIGEGPSLQFDFQRIMTSGVEKFKKGSTKIKDKQLLKSKRMVPLLDFPAICLTIWDKKSSQRPSGGTSLKEYTKSVIKQKPKPIQHDSSDENPFSQLYKSMYDPLAKANFPIEKDLHIEQLTDSYQNLSNAQIVQIQLRAVDQFIEDAIRAGVDVVYLIHGVGKGYLKNAIAKRLKYHTSILTVKNEYHPKYGYGATEVILI